MVLFNILYEIISWTCTYYGEMITYLGMTAPIAVFAFISWIKNPYKGNKAEVKVNHISKKVLIVLWVLFFQQRIKRGMNNGKRAISQI